MLLCLFLSEIVCLSVTQKLSVVFSIYGSSKQRFRISVFQLKQGIFMKTWFEIIFSTIFMFYHRNFLNSERIGPNLTKMSHIFGIFMKTRFEIIFWQLLGLILEYPLLMYLGLRIKYTISFFHQFNWRSADQSNGSVKILQYF